MSVRTIVLCWVVVLMFFGAALVVDSASVENIGRITLSTMIVAIILAGAMCLISVGVLLDNREQVSALAERVSALSSAIDKLRDAIVDVEEGDAPLADE